MTGTLSSAGFHLFQKAKAPVTNPQAVENQYLLSVMNPISTELSESLSSGTELIPCSAKKMKCTTFAAVLYLAGNLAHGGEGAKPPEAWEGGIRTKHQEVWDQLRKDDGKVSAGEVIEWIYKNWRSKHDGDSQLSSALCLVQLDDDPLPHLKKMMAETSPERRAYAALVAGILGDSRLLPDLEKLSDDNAKLGQFEDDWFWKTVSEAAQEALRSMGEGGVAGAMRAEGQYVSAWLPNENKKQNKPALDNP